MTPERHLRAKIVFFGACELPPAEIPAFIQAQCGGDADVAQQVYALLAADAHEDDFLQPGAVDPDLTTPERIVGERGYQIVRQIGEGGMGQVYLAERSDGSFRQRVAIKLLHRSQRPSHDALQRFRAERQILASLNHPNIARLLDGGALSNGAPFLVMEYIDGERLDEWCASRKLNIHERLALFLKICDAVQTAHEALIVHRDLKPSNILVTPQGEPKLLDFGIAKVLNAQWFAHSMPHTRTGHQPMTLAYASPEQVRGAAVGTASDVFSLGVVLYELLTGSLPYRVPSSDPVSLARAVCEEQAEAPSRNTLRVEITEPFAPSTAHTRLPPEQIAMRRQLRGDLDAIVLKALRKESELRYGSVEKFAADIRRYLDGQVVLARRGSRSYRIRKFLLRQRWPVGAGTALFVVLLVSVMLLRAQLERTRIERDKAEQVAQFIVGMLDQSNPVHNDVRDSARAARMTVREAIDRQAPHIETDLARSPQVQATLLAAVARIYNGLSLPEAGRRFGQAALGKLRETGQIPSHASVQVRIDLVQSLANQWLYDAALVQAELAIAESASFSKGEDFDHARALRSRGSVLRNMGQWPQAKRDLEAALDLFRRVRGAEDIYVAGTLLDLSVVANGQGDFVRCESLVREAMGMVAEQVGQEHLFASAMGGNLAACLIGRGDLANAEAALREKLNAEMKALGKDSLTAAVSANDLANVLNMQREFAAAETLLRDSIAVQTRQLGDRHPSLAPPTLNLSTAVFEQGRIDEAIDLQIRALELQPRDQKQAYAVSLNNLGYKLFQVGRMPQAEARLREAITLFQEAAPKHTDLALSLSTLGRLLIDTDRAADALPLIESALAIRVAALPPEHWAIADSRSLLGGCLAALNRPAEAEPLLRQGLRGLTSAFGADNARTQRAQARLDAFIAKSLEKSRP